MLNDGYNFAAFAARCGGLLFLVKRKLFFAAVEMKKIALFESGYCFRNIRQHVEEDLEIGDAL